MANSMTFFSESCKGEQRPVEVYFDYEPAWRGTDEVQGTAPVVCVRKIEYKGRNITRRLREYIDYFETEIAERYND